MKLLKKYRYLILRRTLQIGILILFAGGNYWGWTILRGNYSSGLILGTIPMADPYAVLQILCSGFLVTTELLLGSLIALFLYGVLFGRVFCSWICPVNLFADLALFISSKYKLNQAIKFSRKIRYWALGLSLVLSIIIGISAFEAISPIGITHRTLIFGLGSGWAIIIAIFLFDLAITKNGWCGHLCTLGAFYALVSRFSLLKVKHIKDKCTNCNKCFVVCHEPQVLNIVGKQSGFIFLGECTNCARCIEVCNDDALNFTIINSFKKANYE